MTDLSQELAPLPIQWSEGMLLTPQHFQQNDIYWERQISSRDQRLHPHGYGIYQLSIDHGALSDGVFVVTQLDAVMRDGLLVQYSSDDTEANLSLVLEDQPQLKELGRLRVYLAVPRRTGAAASSKADVRRFDSIKQLDLVDENTGMSGTDLERLKPRLSLLPARDSRYSVLPLAEIEVGVEGGYSLTGYLPPMLRLSAADFLGNKSPRLIANKVLVDLRKKANRLAKNLSSGSGYDAITASQHALMLHYLVAGLPQLEILVDSEGTHPLQFYLALAGLSGQLAALSESAMPPKPPAYQHEHARRGINTCLASITMILKTIKLAYTSFDFKAFGQRAFALDFQKNWQGHRLVLEAVAQTGQSNEDVVKWFSKAKFASQSQHELLAKYRINGIKLKNIARDDQLGLVSGVGRVLFEIASEEVQIDGRDIHLIEAEEALRLDGMSIEGRPDRVLLHVATDSSVDMQTLNEAAS